jgi:hypothetical protein
MFDVLCGCYFCLCWIDDECLRGRQHYCITVSNTEYRTSETKEGGRGGSFSHALQDRVSRVNVQGKTRFECTRVHYNQSNKINLSYIHYVSIHGNTVMLVKKP